MLDAVRAYSATADAPRRASRNQQIRDADEAIERANADLDDTIRQLGELGLLGRPASQQTLEKMTTALDDAHSVRARLGDAGESNAIGPDDIDNFLHDPAKRLAAWRRLITDTVESVTVAPADDGGWARQSPLEPSPGSTSGSGPSIHREAARSDNTLLPSTPSGPTTRTTLPTIAKSNVVVGHDFREKMKREDRRHQCGADSSAPGASSARTRVAGSPGERRSGALAGRCGSLCQQARRRFLQWPPQASLPACSAEDRTVDHADRLASGEYEVRRRRGPRHLHCCERSTRRKGAKSAAQIIPEQYPAWPCLPFRKRGSRHLNPWRRPVLSSLAGASRGVGSACARPG